MRTSGVDVGGGEIAFAVVEFLGISVGSLVSGVACGLLCSYICKHSDLKDYPKYEIVLLFLFAYGSYALAEAIGLSGIMAIFFAGIVLAHYNSYNLSPTSNVTAEEIFEAFAAMAETFVFVYMGMGIFTGRFTQWNVGFIVLAILFCLIGRAFNTFPLAYLSNKKRTQKIPPKMQVRVCRCTTTAIMCSDCFFCASRRRLTSLSLSLSLPLRSLSLCSSSSGSPACAAPSPLRWCRTCRARTLRCTRQPRWLSSSSPQSCAAA